MMKVLAGSLILVLGLTGCGSPRSDGADAREPAAAAPETPALHEDCPIVAGVGPRLAAVDNWFGPDCLTVRSDAVLYVQNFGTYDHTFTISEAEFGRAPFLLDVDLPGKDRKPRPVELSGVLEPGTYEFFCRLHGSMDGTLKVVAPSEG